MDTIKIPFAYRVLLSDGYYEEQQEYRICPSLKECVDALIERKLPAVWAAKNKVITAYFSGNKEKSISMEEYIVYSPIEFVFDGKELKDKAQLYLDNTLATLKEWADKKICVTGIYMSTDFNEIYEGILSQEKDKHEATCYSYKNIE